MADEHPTIRTLLTAVTAIALPFAYFAAPLIRFANATNLALSGIAIGCGAACTWMAMREGWGRAHDFFYTGMAVVGMGALMIELGSASRASDVNDQRCFAVQRDMLSAHPRMANGFDVFQALGCRPQGAAGILVPPTDRERKAHRALPNGGYLRW